MICYIVVLHANKLSHTDLKPENILFVNSDFEIIEMTKAGSKSKRVSKYSINVQLVLFSLIRTLMACVINCMHLLMNYSIRNKQKIALLRVF